MSVAHLPSSTAARRWAHEGGTPLWSRTVPFGQQALPPREQLDAALRELFDRQWYTNQGPLTRQLEAALAERLGVRHALVVTNETIAALMAAEAVARPGLRVGVSALAPAHVVQALAWAGWQPQLLDVQPDGEVPAQAWQSAALDAAVDVDPFGRGRDLSVALKDRAGADWPVIADRSRGACWPLKGMPHVTTVLSLHADQLLSTLEGGCIALDDDALAAKLRNIRSSYGAGPAVEVIKTSNGRMSEAQALVGLLNLQTLDDRLARNRARTARLRDALQALPGVQWLGGEATAADSECQQWVLRIDAAAFGLSAARLIELLRAEGLDARGHAGPAAHRAVVGAQADRCPVAAAIAAAWLQLPQPASLSDEDVDRIAGLLAAAHHDAARLQPRQEEQRRCA